MSKSLKKLEKTEKKRLLEKLAQTEPGSKEYRELQTQLGAFAIMDEKSRNGKISAKDVVGWCLTGVSTVLVVGADQLIPRVDGKLKLADMAKKVFK